MHWFYISWPALKRQLFNLCFHKLFGNGFNSIWGGVGEGRGGEERGGEGGVGRGGEGRGGEGRGGEGRGGEGRV